MLNNLPAPLQAAVQQGFLEKAFMNPLTAKLGFRSLAEKETFPAAIGETLTKTRDGLFPPVTTPLAPAANTDLTSGMVPQVVPIEQYTLSVNQYAANTMLNLVTSAVAIAPIFLRNAAKLAEQAYRSVDTLARNALFASYASGNTRVRVTLGAAGNAVTVDDITGFSAGSVVIGNGSYTIASVAADGTNLSTTPGGASGTLTMTSNVSVSDGTAGNGVVFATAPMVMRANGASSVTGLAGGTLTMNALLGAKSYLESQGLMGRKVFFGSPVMIKGLFNDPEFASFLRGQYKSVEFTEGVVADILGVTITQTNLNPTYSLAGVGPIQRGIMATDGCLIEGQFTPVGYSRAQDVDSDMITVAEGIAHVIREPIDALRQVVTQSWSYIGGFCVPTDINTSPLVLPTASNANFKRAVVLDSV